MELPFELYKNHKDNTKTSWKKSGKDYKGLIATEEEFESIYQKYIYATNCELCHNKFKSRRDRHMEHNHETGEFRNIVCNSCNQRKKDIKIRKHNTSGFIGIYKRYGKTYNQGYTWEFRLTVNGKRTNIKSSIDKEYLIKFAEEWKKKNLYYT